MSSNTSTPNSAIPAGISVGGPIRRMRLSILPSSSRFDRATREWAMSPQIAIGQPVQPPLGAADRQRIEQRLRGMLVPPVARVQHRAMHLLRQQVDRAGGRVTHHQQIGVHRV
jgi:hypothetical protein